MDQYQSLYRKWRPQFFEDIIGQEHVTRTLMNAIKLNRIGHAYIFSGPRGVGKTTTARILAKSLNCINGPTDHPCNQCQQCIRINHSHSMDVIEIDGASNRGIDEIRELRSKIGFAPVEGQYKVYIIDEVHMLTNEAFNALLKTLEEPPGRVLFVFATTAPQKVPKTILSRCQCFHFRRISIDEIVEKLGKITAEEKIDIDLSSLRLIAENATGSMRDAESILDQVITYCEKQVTLDKVKEILGVLPQEMFLQLMKTIIDGNTRAGLEIIDRLVKEGVDLHQFVQDMLMYTHRLSLMKILGKDSHYFHALLEGKELEDLSTVAEFAEMKLVLDIIEELNQIEVKLRYHHFPWILLELFMVKITQGKIHEHAKIDGDRLISSAEMSKQKKDLLEDTEAQKKRNVFNTGEISDDKTQKTVQIDALWPKILSRVKNERISLYAFLMANSNLYIEDDRLMIGFQQDCLFHKESLEKRENKEKVEEILKEESNLPLKLQCFIEENGVKKETSSHSKRNQGKIEDEQLISQDTEKRTKKTQYSSEKHLFDHEVLQKAHDLFGGNISEE